MALYWNGRDITEYVNILGCIYRDSAGGRSDSLELTLDHASTWYRWGPEEDDEIVYISGSFTTGKMYLSAILPEGDRFRVLATSIRQAANRKAWEIFAGKTLEEIIAQCASECGMEGRLYGTSGSLPYPFVVRQNTGCAAFLNRLGEWEGLAVKALDGAFRCVYVPWAQQRSATQSIEISGEEDGVIYRRRESGKYTALTVQSPYASATARDSAAKGNNATVVCLPAMDNAQAGRWARGLLLSNNRRAEELILDQVLNIGMGSLSRVDIASSAAMAGSWIVEEAEHDFFNKRTRTRLYRVIDTIQ